MDESAWARPSAVLRPYVAHYSGWRQQGVPRVTHRGLPSPYLTLVVTLVQPLVVLAHPDGRQAPGSYDALLGGLHLAPALIAHGGRQSGVQVGPCTRWAAVASSACPRASWPPWTSTSPTPRHLTDRFRAKTGLGLKEAARVVRFDRARRRLTPDTPLARLAADAGYYDQAHLAREFRALAGCSPTRWLADEFIYVQDQPPSTAQDDGHG